MDDGTWAPRAQVEDPHAFGSHFGYTVSMRGSTTAVGAPFTKSGSMASWFQGTLASRPKSTEFRVHGSVVILEEEQVTLTLTLPPNSNPNPDPSPSPNPNPNPDPDPVP